MEYTAVDMLKIIVGNVRRTYYDYWRNFCKIYSPKRYADILYKETFGYPINWKHPRDLNEVINVLAFEKDTTRWAYFADKYRVREYVKRCGLESILIPILGVWDRVEDIDLSTLPSRFVLKTNNGSGDVLVVRDKNIVTKEALLRHFNDHSLNFGIETAEPHYLRIKSCIIAEELLDVSLQSIKSSSLVDYKIWCINGKPCYIYVCYNRTAHRIVVGTYDVNWNFHPEFSVSSDHYQLMEKPIPAPYNLQKMLNIATQLAGTLPLVRVDLYEVDKKVYFGEMTLTSAGGRMTYFSPDFLKKMGKKVKF